MDEYIDFSVKGSLKGQEIEMRGINDRKCSLKSQLSLEEFEIDTKVGFPVRVHVQRGKKETGLITFHDIGTNYISFLSFFNYPEMRVILENFTVYHVCAPGHNNIDNSANFNNEYTREENYRLLSNKLNSGDPNAEIFTISSESLSKKPLDNYPSMADLADIIADVVDHFHIKYFLGFGMGAGCNVLTRYGLLYPNKLLGLFLMNPDDTTTGYYPWTRAIWSDIPYLKTGVVTDWIQNWLLDHWFGSCTERNMDLEQSYLQLLGELNPVAVAGYIESYMNRTALGMTRPINSLETNTSTLKVDAFLVTGEMATDLSRAMVEMNGNMDPAKTQFISVIDATGAVMDETPDKLSVLFLNYLRNLGIMVTVTPEKLQRAAVEQQIQNAREMQTGNSVHVAYECSM